MRHDTQATAKLMTITKRKGDAGLFYATSEDEPTLFVSAQSETALNAAVSRALEDLFVTRDRCDVAVFPVDASDKVAIVPRKSIEEPHVHA